LKLEGEGMKFSIIKLMLILILISPVAQSRTFDKRVSLGEEFTLRPGKQVTIGDAKLKIRFVSVVEDSRCPKGVDCVWQGNAKARFELIATGKRRASIVMLNTGVAPKERAFSGYTVKLARISPEPKSGQKMRPREYEATLIVSKR
jgi:hypothetical protein